MRPYLPFIKLIFKKEGTEKRLGHFANLGDATRVCTLLPVGNYSAIKMRAGRRQATYPGPRKFKIEENKVTVHFTRSLAFDSPAPRGKFNLKSKIQSTLRPKSKRAMRRFLRRANRERLKIIYLE